MRSASYIFMFLLIQAMALSQPCPDSLYLTSQAQVDSFQILYPNCTDIEGDVYISGDDITSLNGLSVLTSIGGDLSIGGGYNGNPALTSLTGLDNVNSIGGDLLILSNDALTSLSGLEGLTSIGGILVIDNNDALSSLTALENVTHIGAGIRIWNNDGFTNLSGLEGITSIGGYLTIHWNAVLTSLSGLEGVTSIGGDLDISCNNALTSLTALEGLTSIGGELSILANNVLINLTGLDNIDATSISILWIYGNYSLSTCEVESVCGYIANPNGAIEIHDNWFGCNSPDEIQDSCKANAVSVKEHYLLEHFMALPNPFTTSTTLFYTLSEPSTVTLSIFNPQGQLIEKIEQEQPKGEQKVQWSAEGLPAGMYYFRIQAGNKVGGGKMVKISGF